MTKLRINTDISKRDLLLCTVLIKAERMPLDALEPVHRLYRVTGGFGSQHGSMGRAVFADSLLTGESVRWNRSDVLGVVDGDEANALVEAFKNDAAPAPIEPYCEQPKARSMSELSFGEQLRTLRSMESQGGSFEHNLAKAAYAADAANFERLFAAFPEFVEKFGPGSDFYQGE